MKTAKEWATEFLGVGVITGKRIPELALHFQQAIDEATAPLKAEPERLVELIEEAEHMLCVATMGTEFMYDARVLTTVNKLRAVLDAAKAGKEET